MTHGGGAGRIIVDPGPADHPLRPWVAGDEDGAVDLGLIVGSLGARGCTPAVIELLPELAAGPASP